MAITFHDHTAVFDGLCTIEETDALLAWLHDHPAAVADLAPCTHLHTALLQILVHHRIPVTREATDPFLQQWIIPLLQGHAPAPPSCTTEEHQP